MSRLLKVLVGVLTGGGIATADVSAGQTLAELHPPQSGIDTRLATLAARLDIWIGLLHVLTLRHEASSSEYLRWMKRPAGQIPAILRAGLRQRITAAVQPLVYNGFSRRIAIVGAANRPSRRIWRRSRRIPS